MEGISDSICIPLKYDHHTGRAVYVTLWPLSRRERYGLGRAGAWGELVAVPYSKWREVLAECAGPREDWRAAVATGGFPVPAHELADADARTLWYSGYVQTYLERDLQVLRAVENLPDFRRLMRKGSKPSSISMMI